MCRNDELSWMFTKGQLISKANCQAVNFSKKRKNEFVFTIMRRVFVHSLEELENTKKTFRTYLTFNSYEINQLLNVLS